MFSIVVSTTMEEGYVSSGFTASGVWGIFKWITLRFEGREILKCCLKNILMVGWNLRWQSLPCL